MSKKVIIWICAVSVVLLAAAAILLCVLLPKGEGVQQPQSPTIEEPGVNEPGIVLDKLSVGQNKTSVNSSMSASYKSSNSQNYVYFKTPTGQESIYGINEDKETLYCKDRIILNTLNPYVVIKFSITNSSNNILVGILDIDTTEAFRYSLSFAYSHDGVKFSHSSYDDSVNSGVSVLPTEIETYYVKVSLRGAYQENDFEGRFKWSFEEADSSHEARIGTKTYATIEEARTASKNYDTICIMKDVSTESIFFIERPLYIYADRNVTWTTGAVSGITLCDYTPNYDCCLWLGCDNGNKLTILSTGGYNAISVGSTSLFLAADVVCGTNNPTSECVGIRVVGRYYLSPQINFLGGSVSKFYYGIVDMTQNLSYHDYLWGSINNCVQGIHVNVGFGSELTESVFNFGLEDKPFYIYNCYSYGIYFDGEVYYTTRVDKATIIKVQNLVMGEDSQGRVSANTDKIVGCAITLLKADMHIKGKFKCNNFTETPINVGLMSSITCLDSAQVEMKNNQGSSGGAIIFSTDRGSSLKNANISYNTATQSGGAIYSKGKYLNLYNCIVEHNISGNLGGAILTEDGDMIIDNCSVSYNTAQSHGGAIYARSNLDLIDSKLFNNDSEGDGGAIFIENIDQDEKRFNIDGETEIFNNTAKTRGGAIRTGEGININLLSGKIYNNSVLNMSAKTSGGGIYVNCGSILTMVSGEIYNNTASGLTSYGGNVYIDKEYFDGNTTVEAAVFECVGGLIAGDGNTIQAMNGGGIANLGLIYMMSCEIRNCVAVFGSGIYNIGTLYITDTKISSLTATQAVGKSIVNIGALHFGPITMEGKDMDIVIACTESSGEVVNYAITNVIVPLVSEEGIEKQYSLTFAIYNSDTKELSLSEDFIHYYIDNNLPLITYDQEGNPFEANENNFVSVNYRFILTEDGCGLKVDFK